MNMYGHKGDGMAMIVNVVYIYADVGAGIPLLNEVVPLSSRLTLTL